MTLRALLLAACLAAPACWHGPTDQAPAVAEASAETAGAVLREAYRAAGLSLIQSAKDRAEAEQRIVELHARWEPVWRAWDHFAAALDAWAHGGPVAAEQVAYCALAAEARKAGQTLPDAGCR